MLFSPPLSIATVGARPTILTRRPEQCASGSTSGSGSHFGIPSTRAIVGHEARTLELWVLRLLRRIRPARMRRSSRLGPDGVVGGGRSCRCNDCQHLVASVEEVDRREAWLEVQGGVRDARRHEPGHRRGVHGIRGAVPEGRRHHDVVEAEPPGSGKQPELVCRGRRRLASARRPRQRSSASASGWSTRHGRALAASTRASTLRARARAGTRPPASDAGSRSPTVPAAPHGS